jgi:hypothetical protein
MALQQGDLLLSSVSYGSHQFRLKSLGAVVARFKFQSRNNGVYIQKVYS